MDGAPPRRWIRFSGHRWWVKRASQPVGPGPNRFDDSDDTVTVRSDGSLVLRVRSSGQQWVCAEIVGERSTGYGSYEWTIADDLTGLQRHVVLGLFTWSDDPQQCHRELDIEVSAWGRAVSVAGQFVVQAGPRPGHLQRFTLPQKAPWRCSFDWTPGRVSFCASGVEPWVVQGRAVPTPGGAHPRINLWLYEGVEPDVHRDVAVTIREFRFTPHASERGNGTDR